MVNYIFDVDNTLAERKSDEIHPEIKQTILEAKSKNWISNICLVSNTALKNDSREKRVKNMAQELGACGFVCALWPNIKPKSKPYLLAMEFMEACTVNTVVVGDQIFSDIKGGNRLGLFTIHVTPLGKDHPITIPRRWLERLVKKIYNF